MKTQEPILARDDLILGVLRQFRLLFGSMKAYFREMELLTGLSGSQLWVLQEVAGLPGISINQIAMRMGVHQSTCSLTVEKLIVAGMLAKRRDEVDFRRQTLMLTEEGGRILSMLPGPAHGILPLALSKMPDVSLKTLIINMDELIQYLPYADGRYASVALADQLVNSMVDPEERCTSQTP